MYTPDLTTFNRLAERGNLIPVHRELLADLDTPVTAFARLDEGDAGFLFESVEGGEKWGRYSILGSHPRAIFRSDREHVTVTKDGGTEQFRHHGKPVSFVREALAHYKPVATDGLPLFFGGAVGYLGYDMVRYIERIPDANVPSPELPEMALMLVDHFVLFDNIKQSILVVALADLLAEPDPELAYAAATRKVDELVERLATPLAMPKCEDQSGTPLVIKANRSRDDYLEAVERAKEYVAAGDVVQAVLSIQFQTEYRGRPYDLYRALRSINPSPYLFYLRLPECTLIGSSPEVLVRLEEERVTLRPIAGTRPRSADAAEDLELERNLLDDPKERAEHVMLVDLGRNDVGRVARTGSVVVDELMVIERYSHVMHIVSNVIGDLAEGKSAYEVLEAAFPAGTLSGAPKIRAMEIIDELEPTRRGPYGGSVGYFGFGGNMDMCIAIRTMVLQDENVYLQAGAGIVYDSVPEREFDECVNKARALVGAIDMARRGLSVGHSKRASEVIWAVD